MLNRLFLVIHFNLLFASFTMYIYKYLVIFLLVALGIIINILVYSNQIQINTT